MPSHVRIHVREQIGRQIVSTWYVTRITYIACGRRGPHSRLISYRSIHDAHTSIGNGFVSGGLSIDDRIQKWCHYGESSRTMFHLTSRQAITVLIGRLTHVSRESIS